MKNHLEKNLCACGWESDNIHACLLNLDGIFILSVISLYFMLCQFSLCLNCFKKMFTFDFLFKIFTSFCAMYQGRKTAKNQNAWELIFQIFLKMKIWRWIDCPDCLMVWWTEYFYSKIYCKIYGFRYWCSKVICDSRIMLNN